MDLINIHRTLNPNKMKIQHYQDLWDATKPELRWNFTPTPAILGENVWKTLKTKVKQIKPKINRRKRILKTKVKTNEIENKTIQVVKNL